MRTRRLATLLILAGCGGTDPSSGPACPSGEATNLVVKGPGAPGTLPASICASGTVRSLTFKLDFAPLKSFELTGSTLETLPSCQEGLNALVYDSQGNYQADWQQSDSSSCSLTAGRAGDRLSGAFTGHLFRLKNDNSKEFLDVSFDYWVKAPAETN